MTPEPLPSELLDLAMDRLLAADAPARAAACDELAAAHPAHAAGLRRLLARMNGAERLLDRSFPAADELSQIGDYRVLRRLGQGAFGTVWLCEQHQPVVRRVAIKVMRPGVGDEHTLRRFAAERQHLASLGHPAITHVYDAGCLADGRPYFVMEYVEGLSIVEHCRRGELSCEQRVRLFVEVCRGVEHAHGRGVVHRDLKPGNILVADGGGAPQPKIIDFGIAKLLTDTASLPGGEPLTGTGHVLGTPGYMSPEQASGTGVEADARTDVFALGVVLFELLTGELPWPRGSRVASDATPILPSARLSTRARDATAAEATAMRRLASRVRGDLDWIVRKATQTDRDERYRSAKEFADDLERHLAGLPVAAGPATLRYRCRKLLRRLRLSWATAALAGLCLSAGVGFAVWRGWRDDAAHYAEVNRLADNLLQRANDADVLAMPQSDVVRAALARDALGFFDQWLRERPQDATLRAGRCRALATLSRVHYALGQSTAALATAELAEQEARALHLEAPAEDAARGTFAEAGRLLGRALQLVGRIQDAGPCLQRAVADLAELAEHDPAQHGRSYASALREWGGNAMVLGRKDDALAANTRSVEVLEGLAARDITAAAARGDLALARVALAMSQTATGNHEAAASTLAAAEAALADVHGERHRATAVVHAQQGRSALRRGDDEAAIDRFTLAAAASERWREHEPRQFQAFVTAHESWNGLAAAHERLEQWPAADAALARALTVREQMVTAFPQQASCRDDLEAGWYDAARTLWYRYRRQDLPTARAWAASLLQAKLQRPTSAVRPYRWECLALAASLADSAGEGSAASWQAVADELVRSGDDLAAAAVPMALEAWLGVARSRIGAGDLVGARAAMQRTTAWLESKHVGDDFRSQTEVGWAHLELADGKLDAAAPHIARILELRPSWWGHWQAAECEREALQVLQANDSAAAAIAARRATVAEHCRTVLAELAAKVEAAPADPWRTAPWCLANLALAEVLADDGDTAGAASLLEAAAPKVAAIAATVHRDVLSAARERAFAELRRRLAADAR